MSMLDELDETEFVDDDLSSEVLEEGDGQLYEHFRIEVDKGQVSVRIDKFLAEHQPHSSRNRIQKAADAGFIHVNGTPVKSNYKVRAGDVVTLMLDRPHYDTTIEPENIPLEVVYEDDDLMVINKPAGMVVHPGCGNFNGTLVNAIAWHLKDLESYDPNDPEVGLVHRIDKDTSGLLVVAKTPDAKTSLGKQFFNKTTHRSYNALVWGNFVEDEGRIEGNIGRDPKDRLRMSVFPSDSEIGKPAVTHFKVLERYGYTTLVECILETGRTHQIRAHMKHIGHPLFCDERYGGNEILRGERTASYKAYIQNCFTFTSSAFSISFSSLISYTFSCAARRMVSIMETRPLARVGDRFSFNPRDSMKRKSSAAISAGVRPEYTRINSEMMPLVIMASLSARNCRAPFSIFQSSHTRDWQPLIRRSSVRASSG